MLTVYGLELLNQQLKLQKAKNACIQVTTGRAISIEWGEAKMGGWSFLTPLEGQCILNS